MCSAVSGKGRFHDGSSTNTCEPVEENLLLVDRECAVGKKGQRGGWRAYARQGEESYHR